MNINTIKFDLDKAINLLGNDSGAMPWSQRRDLVIQAASQYDNNELTVYNLFALLANDEKWEVRKAVADNLHILSDVQVIRIASKLTNDANVFVKTAAQRAIERKRKIKREDTAAQDVLLRYADKLHRMQQTHGVQAVETALQIAEDRCNILAGSVSHDLLNILTPLGPEIDGAIKQANQSGTTKLLCHLTSIKENFEFLRQTVQDVEDLAKDLPDEKHMENVDNVLAEAIHKTQQNIVALGFDASKIIIDVVCSDKLQFLVCRQSLIMAIVNILKNAYESFLTCDNQLREGKINISVTPESEKLKITVSDNGMGISEDEIKRLTTYVPGRRNKSKKKSTGYGLPLAKRYIQKHDGDIFIRSREDHGTEITIVLPQYTGAEPI
jgi:signal transduction histidine kinase